MGLSEDYTFLEYWNVANAVGFFSFICVNILTLKEEQNHLFTLMVGRVRGL